jgi:SAM-dependent methyltransferase
VVRFFQILDRVAAADSEILDVGAGDGTGSPHGLRGRVKRIVGVDVDSNVMRNSRVDEAIVADASRAIPVPSCSFDLAFSVYTLEHIRRPERLAAELYRVLRPGGWFLALTPNRWHYVAIASRVTPFWFHRWYNTRRGRDAKDTFPTYYRLNTRRQLRREFCGAGFREECLDAIEVEPHYLKGWCGTFLLGVAYERIVNATPLLAALRVNWIVIFRKPAMAIK